MKYQWKKVYKGPFKQTEAIALVGDIKKIADPETNGILKIALRKRSKTNKYDIMVKIEKDENQ